MPPQTEGGFFIVMSPEAAHPASKAERALWCAVIELALIDAGIINPATRPRKCAGSQPDNPAVNWLLHDNMHFYTVCDMAGISPEALRLRVKKKLKHPVH